MNPKSAIELQAEREEKDRRIEELESRLEKAEKVIGAVLDIRDKAYSNPIFYGICILNKFWMAGIFRALAAYEKAEAK